jgi:hypothetical protein
MSGDDGVAQPPGVVAVEEDHDDIPGDDGTGGGDVRDDGTGGDLVHSGEDEVWGGVGWRVHCMACFFFHLKGGMCGDCGFVCSRVG